MGNQGRSFRGAINAADEPLLTIGAFDALLPPDVLGNEGAGQIIRDSGDALVFWFRTIASFGQIATVTGAPDPSNGNPTIRGLGPSFNGTSCAMCHAHPAIGGSSPGPGTPGFTQNPQIAASREFGARNPQDYSAFITPNGPVREARFIMNESDPSRRTPDGTVHGLYTIEGRSDAPGCVAPQPDIATQFANNNVSFRIPTPTYGLGLIENVSDEDLIANAARETNLNPNIHAKLNRSGNDGTVARFGWKAQNKSLYLFSAEAANVEMGVTNEVFPNERSGATNCNHNALPEDETSMNFQLGSDLGDTDVLVSSMVENFTAFMRFNGAASQCDFSSGVDANGAAVCKQLSTSSQNGFKLFLRVGCMTCHTQNLTTQPSTVPGLSNRTFQPYSDFAVHHMGSTLADGITQGLAGPDEFRTAPLWGLGQRLFFLHDGRTSDLKQAILAHASPVGVCFANNSSQNFTVTFPFNGNSTSVFSPSSSGTSCGSEANGVIDQFNSLSVAQQQDLLNFLRSL